MAVVTVAFAAAMPFAASPASAAGSLTEDGWITADTIPPPGKAVVCHDVIDDGGSCEFVDARYVRPDPEEAAYLKGLKDAKAVATGHEARAKLTSGKSVKIKGDHARQQPILPKSWFVSSEGMTPGF
jgi:hypothetical protein